MADLDKALAAAREATTRYAAESARVHGPQHLNHYAERMADANIALFDAIDAARGEAVAFLYTLEYGSSVADRKASTYRLNYPFGVCGADYLRSREDGVSYVRETPLYPVPPAPLEAHR